MNDSMKVPKITLQTRVRRRSDGRRGTIIQILSLTKDPLVNVKLDKTENLDVQEMVGNYSLFEPLGPLPLQKGKA